MMDAGQHQHDQNASRHADDLNNAQHADGADGSLRRCDALGCIAGDAVGEQRNQHRHAKGSRQVAEQAIGTGGCARPVAGKAAQGHLHEDGAVPARAKAQQPQRRPSRSPTLPRIGAKAAVDMACASAVQVVLL